MSNTNRNKGHNAEREYVNIFKLFHPQCKSSREASRLYDNCKIDIWGIPIMIQVKSGYGTNIPHSKILDGMELLINKNFKKDSIECTSPKIIIHKKDKSTLPGKPRASTDTIVAMTLDDFLKHFYPNYAKSLSNN